LQANVVAGNRWEIRERNDSGCDRSQASWRGHCASEALTKAAPPTALPEVKVRESAPEPDYNPPVSSIGGGVGTPVRDIPQSVTVINNALMRAQAATSLGDALRNVPGITMGAAEGGSIGNNFNLRGFSARTDLSRRHACRGRYRDVFSLDSVEVLQGPSSMLFGRGSTGGVINQASKLPSLTLAATATVTGGTQPSARVTADVNQTIDGTSAYRIAAMAQVNSSNYGYNLPIKFLGADYYALNRTEAELCLHERGLPLR
jgi:catecholate siderophore receptor